MEISRRPAASLGFRNVLADLAWLESVQVAGDMEMAREDYDRLYRLLNVVANYDPRFEIPYLMGGLILGESPFHVRQALDILGRGRVQHPGDWRFFFHIGYTHYFSLGDPAEGGRAMAEAAQLPKSPSYLGPLAARMLSEGREPETALALLEIIERRETDEARRTIIRRRMREVVVERDIQLLERLVRSYRDQVGRLPGSLSELVQAGLIRRVPREPHGGSYRLLPGGIVRSDMVERRLEVFRKP